MKNERTQTIFFLIILIASFSLLTFLIYPLLGALTISLALAITFRPIFRRLVKKLAGRQGLAAWATIAIVIVIVIIPLSLIGMKVFNEVKQIYDNSINGSFAKELPPQVSIFLNKYAPNVSFDLAIYKQKIVDWLFVNLNNIFSSAINIIFNLFIIFITLYYLLKDGRQFREVLQKLSPLPEQHTKTILSRLELTMGSVVKGTIIIALAHGLMAGIGFTIFGAPQPVLLSLLTAVSSILPGVGAGLVFIPLIIYLATIGNYFSAIGLAIWGTIIVGSIDNILRPYLLKRDIQIHPLLILLSVLGGLSVFGALGFILGPIILSFVYSLSDIYLDDKKQHEKSLSLV